MTAFDQGKAGVASGINNAASRASGLELFGGISPCLWRAAVRKPWSQRPGFSMPNWRRETVAAIEVHRQRRLAVLESQDNLLTAAQVPDGLAPEMAVELEAAIDNSFLAGYRAAMWLSAGLAAASAVFAAAMIRYKPEAQA